MIADREFEGTERVGLEMGEKTLEAAVTTGDNPQWLWQSSTRLKDMEEE